MAYSNTMRCVLTTPFESPVDPLVKRMVDQSVSRMTVCGGGAGTAQDRPRSTTAGASAQWKLNRVIEAGSFDERARAQGPGAKAPTHPDRFRSRIISSGDTW